MDNVRGTKEYKILAEGRTCCKNIQHLFHNFGIMNSKNSLNNVEKYVYYCIVIAGCLLYCVYLSI